LEKAKRSIEADHARKTKVAQMILDVGRGGDLDDQTYERLVAACEAADESEVEVTPSYLGQQIKVTLKNQSTFSQCVVEPVLVMHEEANTTDE
jgi:hypothetical protein